MKQIVAVVHARGGSVRVPLKNIRLLGGLPLIVWTVKAALASRCDRVIVSTDHDGIAEIARAAGADVPFRRPPEIAADVASELVTQHAIRHHEQEVGNKVDIAVTIQPTTPFLTAADINGCIDLLCNDPDLDSAFTAVQYISDQNGCSSGKTAVEQANLSLALSRATPASVKLCPDFGIPMEAHTRRGAGRCSKKIC